MTSKTATKDWRSKKFIEAQKNFSREQRYELEKAILRIKNEPNKGFKASHSNVSRVWVHTFQRHCQLLIPYVHTTAPDHIYFVDAIFYFGDPVETREQMEFIASYMTDLEKKHGARLMTDLLQD